MGKRGIAIIIYIILGFILPYTYIGYNSANMILALVGISILITYKKIKVNKRMALILSLLASYAIIQTLIFSREMNSIAGLSVYILPIVSYLLFTNIEYERDIFIKSYVYTVAIVSLVNIIYQGIILDVRVDGNIGYANTYAMLLVVGIYFSKVIEQRILNRLVNIVLIVGILFSGSRTTLILFGILLIFRVIKQKEVHLIYELSIAIIIYILLDLYIVIAIFIMPIIIYILTLEINKKPKKIVVGLIFAIMMIGVMFLPTNTFNRLKNINITNGSLQERIITFEDGIKAIIKKPEGYGVNNYLYEINKYKTANYNIRYIHNSLLQNTFELGILGGIIFLVFIIYSIYILYKSHSTHEELILFILCILHSFVEFDFQYGTFVIAIMLILSKAKTNKEIKVNKVGLSIVILLLTSILVNELILGVGRVFWINNEIESAKNLTQIAYIKDWRYHYINVDYEVNNEQKKEQMTKVMGKKESDIIRYKYATLYQNDDYEKYKLEMINLEKAYRFSPEYYKEFYMVAERNKDLEMMEIIEKNYRRAKNNINRKAKYLPKQIK